MKQTIRFKILQRDNFTCQYCGRKAPEVILEIDHKIPRSKGGLNRPDNLVVACSECNGGKGNTLLDEKPVIKNEAIKTSDFRRSGFGIACNKCGRFTDRYLRTQITGKTLKQAYYFKEYNKCSFCGKMFMIEASKVRTKV